MTRFLNVRQRHFGGAAPAAPIGAMPFGAWLEEAYLALRTLGRDPDDAQQFERLDRIHAAFLAWCTAHGRAWSDGFLRGHAIRSGPRVEVPPGWYRIASEIPNAVALPVE
jgi:hypothetical protein